MDGPPISACLSVFHVIGDGFSKEGASRERQELGQVSGWIISLRHVNLNALKPGTPREFAVSMGKLRKDPAPQEVVS